MQLLGAALLLLLALAAAEQPAQQPAASLSAASDEPAAQKTAPAEPPLPDDLPSPDSRWEFFNVLSGRRQRQDPGHTPYVHPPTGRRFWPESNAATGVRRWVRAPNLHANQHHVHSWGYVWVELWSAEQERSYFYNQATHDTTWERPVDLAWIRLPVEGEVPPAGEAPPAATDPQAPEPGGGGGSAGSSAGGSEAGGDAGGGSAGSSDAGGAASGGSEAAEEQGGEHDSAAAAAAGGEQPAAAAAR